MMRAWAVTVVAALAGAVVASPVPADARKAPDATEFVKAAVLNGLAEDGVSPGLARKLAGDENYVVKCEICAPTQLAMREYAKRAEAPPAKEGKGLAADLRKRLEAEGQGEIDRAMMELVQRYVEREYARRDLSAEQAAALQKELNERRERAARNFLDRKSCPVCNGACRVDKPKPNP